MDGLWHWRNSNACSRGPADRERLLCPLTSATCIVGWGRKCRAEKMSGVRHLADRPLVPAISRAIVGLGAALFTFGESAGESSPSKLEFS
jgi:hypothetical protein